MNKLLEEITIRGTRFRNRLWVSPMCQYSSIDGMPTDWHLVHLGSRAVGGAGAVFMEATAVSPEGRISPADMGIWNEDQASAMVRITDFIKQQGSVAAIQLAHAGRKASTAAPWDGGSGLNPDQGGWEVLAPSAVAFSDDYPMPREMDFADIEKVVDDFSAAAERSIDAGFQVIEVHAAHGYLLHEFLSPLSNHRSDQYGGDLTGRMRFPLRVVSVVREAVPRDMPVFVRISATDWAEGGWDLSQSIEFCRNLADLGVDLIDCSSGGLVPNAKIQIGPGYQVPFAEAIKKATDLPTAAVGMITDPGQAEEIVKNGRADAVMVAREFLRDPYFAFRAAAELDEVIAIPKQYGRAIESRLKQ